MSGATSTPTTDGHKVEVAIAAAGAVTVATILVSPVNAAAALTAFFGFLGGLLMGKVLG